MLIVCRVLVLRWLYCLPLLPISSVCCIMFVWKKPVVAVDIDEVLAHFVPALAEFHNHKFGTDLTADDFHSYSFAEVWVRT